uniref:DUF7948 domain-containing protein n=2 Tax=Kuenenia stuttgartiensis TaxID=174633 RepID=Q1Q581_KUEST|nr:conserved hypothetical protein related to cell surface glycoprotein (S layer protein) [Candidatus Kuenenia stuttgartiensis]
MILLSVFKKLKCYVFCHLNLFRISIFVFRIWLRPKAELYPLWLNSFWFAALQCYVIDGRIDNIECLVQVACLRISSKQANLNQQRKPSNGRPHIACPVRGWPFLIIDNGMALFIMHALSSPIIFLPIFIRTIPMKKRNPFFIFSIVLSFLFGFAFSSFAQEHKDTPSGKAVNQKIKKLQIPFIANEGQADEKVAYYANTFGGTVFVTKDGEIVYSLPKGSDVENTDCRGELHSPYMIHDAGCGIHYNHKSCIKSCRLDEACPAPVEGMERTQQISDPHSPTPKSQPPTPNTFLQGIALKETLIGAKVKEIKGEDKSATKINYFKGNDQKKWKSNISTYDVVNLGEVYKGIELKLKAYGNNVEKLFHVKPGADPNRIKIRLSGIQPPESSFFNGDLAESSSTKGSLAKSPLTKGGRGVVSPDVWVNEQGELVAETELGPVTFTKPIAYQEIDGKRVEVEVKYVIRDYEPIAVKYSMNTGTDNGHVSRTYGFAVASYDKTKELVIDPLLASTYLGGSSEDYAHAISLDSEENVYVAGYTGSTDFPITEGSYSASYSGEDYDVFVSKLNSDLTSLLASTYLGGSEMDFAYSMDIDSSGNVYITGNTYSSDFPATLDAYNSSRNDSTYCDLFISKLDSNLSSLLESTYLGGNNYDYVECIDVDANGNVYVAGYTHSSNFPTTSGAYDVSYNGFRSDSAFVSKLSSNLNSLLASTFFGGQDDDCIKSLAVDTSGNIYVTGYTYSQDFPTTAGADYGRVKMYQMAK